MRECPLGLQPPKFQIDFQVVEAGPDQLREIRYLTLISGERRFRIGCGTLHHDLFIQPDTLSQPQPIGVGPVKGLFQFQQTRSAIHFRPRPVVLGGREAAILPIGGKQRNINKYHDRGEIRPVCATCAIPDIDRKPWFVLLLRDIDIACANPHPCVLHPQRRMIQQRNLQLFGFR